MASYGRQDLGLQVGFDLALSADGYPEWKAGGVTLDWATVTAVAGSDVTLLDNTVVKVGEKALRYGQVLTKITASGKFGPFDTAATDGRQLLVRGECYIMNTTMREYEPLNALGASLATDHPGVIEGGLIWYARLLLSTATNELGGPAGPTLANFNTAFPRIRYVKN